jgi:hypothetical protein
MLSKISRGKFTNKIGYSWLKKKQNTMYLSCHIRLIRKQRYKYRKGLASSDRAVGA